ncbi:hypothetical protein K9L05_01605 [Candidatus Babeliales bacterium]|nr:hypothetical protein [Candidatus Babeliales bacterium]MCF7899327.1 hypothetical protein [Candidatus Babeliales bacterium]
MNFYKNFFQKLFLTVFIFSNFLNFNYIFSYTNKTYLRQLDTQFLVPNKNFSDFILYQKDFAEKTRLNFDIDASLFYFESTNSKDLGKYFGVNETNNIQVSDFNQTMDVYHDFLVHFTLGGPVAPRQSLVKLSPKSYLYGLNLNFLYNFHFFEKLYLKLTIPFIESKNNLKAQFSPSGYDTDENSNIIQEYLTGEYENTLEHPASIINPDTKMQEKLINSVIGGSKSRGGISDLYLNLGLNVLENKNSIFLYAGIVIPTSNKSKGKVLFEPINGNGGHFGINLGMDSVFNLWVDSKNTLDCFLELKYQYLFENSQTRILSIKGANWGQYYLLGKDNQNNQSLIPAANILAQNVNVSPGSQIDFKLKLLLNLSKFDISLGYGFIAREEEEVKLKNFTENEYAVADTTFDTSGHFEVPDDSRDNFSYYLLNSKNIDTTASQNPAIFANKFDGNIGYNFYFNKLVLNTNFGAGYYLPMQNSSAEGYFLRLDLGLLF